MSSTLDARPLPAGLTWKPEPAPELSTFQWLLVLGFPPPIAAAAVEPEIFSVDPKHIATMAAARSAAAKEPIARKVPRPFLTTT